MVVRSDNIVDRKTWKEFRETGLLWFINMILHMFGWSIVVSLDKDEIVEVYPARVKFRGFDEDINTNGYKKVSKYMFENVEQLLSEAKE